MKFSSFLAGASLIGLGTIALSPSLLLADTNTDKLEHIIAGDHRSAENKARDVYRHPLETLQWFGLRDDMTVVEISPGNGWYTEIIAPFVKDSGKYYAAGFDPNSSVDFLRKGAQRFNEKLKASPKLYGEVTTTVLAPPDQMDIAPAGSADLVLTFRNVHNWLAAGTAADVFTAMYRALKPGGTLGVVEHRAAAEKPLDPKAASGYVAEEQVMALAKEAGFEFVDRSEINANPADTKDYAEGVWTLPPTLRLGDKDREHYLAIGESDRMTLKFVKPNMQHHHHH
ncbi:MAG: methyltransferase [Chromatiales bacterium]|jgi:predicted methyltransferase|nr:methyltransferase [Chromatiales bacterium]